MSENQAETNELDQPLSIWFILFLPIYAAVFIGLFVFLPAGSLRWLEGWILVGSMSLNMGLGAFVLNKKNPRALRNRMKTKKEGLTALTKKSASSDRLIMPLMAICFLGAVVVAGWGYRLNWYQLPFWVALAGAIVVNLGEILMLIATSQNAFASKILDINKGQKLIDSGLYAHVRHPLYSGAILMIVFWPIALGSLWGLPMSILAGVSLIIRIHFEEEMLLKGMEGYAEYRERVKYKLIPKIY